MNRKVMRNLLALVALLVAGVLVTGCGGGGGGDMGGPVGGDPPGTGNPPVDGGPPAPTNFNDFVQTMVLAEDEDAEPESLNEKTWVVDDSEGVFDDVFES